MEPVFQFRFLAILWNTQFESGAGALDFAETEGAEVTGGDAARCFVLVGERAGLEIDEEAALLFRGLACGGLDAGNARRIHGDRLGEPDVQSGLHSGFDLFRMEIWR